MSDDHTGLNKLNSRKYLAVAVAATFSVWYAQFAQSVHAVDVLDSFIYGVVQSVFSSLGGLITFFIGSFILVMLPVAGMVGLYQLGCFYWASLLGFWLGINLINVGILNLSTGNLSALLCAAGYVCLALATLAGVIFSRERLPLPDHTVRREAWPPHGDSVTNPTSWSPPPAKPAWALPGSGLVLLLSFVGLYAAYGMYVHGGDWLGALVSPGASQEAWPDNFKTAMARAAAEHKPVFLHFTGSDWCPACQELDRSILETTAFRNYAAQNLVFVEVDMPRSKSQPAEVKKQNQDLVNEFDIQGFPTVILLNRVGKNIGEEVGCPQGMGPTEYIAQLEKFIKADGVK